MEHGFVCIHSIAHFIRGSEKYLSFSVVRDGGESRRFGELHGLHHSLVETVCVTLSGKEHIPEAASLGYFGHL